MQLSLPAATAVWFAIISRARSITWCVCDIPARCLTVYAVDSAVAFSIAAARLHRLLAAAGRTSGASTSVRVRVWFLVVQQPHHRLHLWSESGIYRYTFLHAARRTSYSSLLRPPIGTCVPEPEYLSACPLVASVGGVRSRRPIKCVIKQRTLARPPTVECTKCQVLWILLRRINSRSSKCYCRGADVCSPSAAWPILARILAGLTLSACELCT